MVATPQFAGFQFVGLKSGQTFNVDAYVSDVSGATVRLDNGGGASATSLEAWQCPEPMVLVDYYQVTGTADTTKIQLCKNGSPTGDHYRYACHLTTHAKRPTLKVLFQKGDTLSAIQRA